MENKIRLGVSSCLLGAKVRYDGGHQFNRYLHDVLGEYVEYVPVCPEVEVGLPVPRDTMRLVTDDNVDVRLVFSRSGEDMTERMEAWAKERIRLLENEQLDGFVFKSKSPSSGMERVKVYGANGMPRKNGTGIFARVFIDSFPLLPVEEEGRLNDPKLRENFITAIFTMRRFREALSASRSLHSIVDFHTRHKLLLFAHHEKNYRQMGRFVAKAKELDFEVFISQYRSLLLETLKYKTTIKKHINVLHHIQGYFKRDLSADEKHETLELIEDYRAELVPLIVPITLLNHFARKYDQPYLKQQVYLNPHPKELKLLNHV
jgi:uncharacterized protein YbgA (DUF1722 family)/uncharacterized protein YbbK (DUF523 family)